MSTLFCLLINFVWIFVFFFVFVSLSFGGTIQETISHHCGVTDGNTCGNFLLCDGNMVYRWMDGPVTVTFELMRRYTCVYRKIFFEIVSSELLTPQYWITLLLGPITMSWIWDSGSVWSKPKNVILSDSVHVIVCLQHFLLFLIRVGGSFTRWSGPLAAIWSLPTNIDDGPVRPASSLL